MKLVFKYHSRHLISILLSALVWAVVGSASEKTTLGVQGDFPSSFNEHAQVESPSGYINWEPPVQISIYATQDDGSNEPAAAQHPSSREHSLVGGNIPLFDQAGAGIENTTNFGASWSRRRSPSCSSLGDGVPVWADEEYNPGKALFVAICSGFPSEFRLSRSTDWGATWAALNTSALSMNYKPDREYLWTDHNPDTNFPSRTYLTSVISTTPLGCDPAVQAVGLQYTTNVGDTWSSYRIVSPTDDQQNFRGLNQFPSLAIEVNGAILEVWGLFKFTHQDPGCGEYGSENQIRYRRSTDGGLTWSPSPYGLIHTIAAAGSIPFTGHSPAPPTSFRWNPAPNVAADPMVNGMYYAVWAAYRDRVFSDPNSAGIYLSRGTLNYFTEQIEWSTPIVVYPGPMDKYQYFPWVQVSRDRVVHITFGMKALNDSTNSLLNAYYVQSTDLGRTFTQPVPLQTYNFPSVDFMGDYQATSVGGRREEAGGGHTETILTTWTQSIDGTMNTQHRWGRLGTFCSSLFTDVPPGNGFYPYIRCLGCRSIISGYECGTVVACDPDHNAIFLLNSRITRGQIAKIVSNAAGFTDAPSGQIFEDVTPYQTFYPWIQRLTSRGYMSGYECGPSHIPCVPPNNRPWFLPDSDATRGQLSKIVSNAAGFTDPPSGQMFEDVPPGHIFYEWVQRLASRNVMQGYTCGGIGEPCISGKPYFRPFNSVTRGQSAKIVANTFFPECTPPSYADEKPQYEPPEPVETIPGPVSTSAPTWTPTPCPGCGNFADVPTYDEFYPYIQCLDCRNIISGYTCGGPGEPCNACNTPYFRPAYYIIRGQLAKMVSNSAGWSEPHTEQTFQDVPTNHDYYVWIQRITSRGVIGGYPCGGSPVEPCVAPNNRPYFRPWTEATRGQVAKAVSNAKGYSEIPTGQTFEDVAVGSTFYYFVERLNSRGIMAGYPCGGPGEPCITGKPYFRPLTSATRAQASKATSRAFFPECNPAGDHGGSKAEPGAILSATVPPQTTNTPIPTGPVATNTSAPTSQISATIPPPLPTIPLPLPTGYVPIPPVATMPGTIPVPSVTVPLP